MSTKTDEAVRMLTEQCKDKDYLIPFEEYLTGIMTDDIADKVLADGKSLQGCFDHMKSIAQKRKTGNFAYIPPEEGYEIIRDYYGISISKREPRKHDRANVLDLFRVGALWTTTEGGKSARRKAWRNTFRGIARIRTILFFQRRPGRQYAHAATKNSVWSRKEFT